jgi:hypothetical protein
MCSRFSVSRFCGSRFKPAINTKEQRYEGLYSFVLLFPCSWFLVLGSWFCGSAVLRFAVLRFLILGLSQQLTRRNKGTKVRRFVFFCSLVPLFFGSWFLVLGSRRSVLRFSVLGSWFSVLGSAVLRFSVLSYHTRLPTSISTRSGALAAGISCTANHKRPRLTTIHRPCSSPTAANWSLRDSR